MKNDIILFNPYNQAHLAKLIEFEETCKEESNISKLVECDIKRFSENEYKLKLQQKEIKEFNIFTLINDEFTMGVYLELTNDEENTLDVEFLANKKSNYKRDLPLLLEAVKALRDILNFNRVVYQFKTKEKDLIEMFITYLEINGIIDLSQTINGDYTEIVFNSYNKQNNSSVK